MRASEVARNPVVRSPHPGASPQPDGTFRPQDMRRDRPSATKGVKQVPGNQRRAELLCREGGRHLVAVAHPRTAPIERLRVTHIGGWTLLGKDFEVSCPCGVRHAIDGGRLRASVLGAEPNRRVRIAVADVSVGGP